MKIQDIKCLIGAALAALLLSPAHGAPPAAPSVVTVDYACPVKTVHSMVGFLHAADAATPGDDRLLPLHPVLWRIGHLWMNNRDRLRELGRPRHPDPRRQLGVAGGRRHGQVERLHPHHGREGGWADLHLGRHQ